MLVLPCEPDWLIVVWLPYTCFPHSTSILFEEQVMHPIVPCPLFDWTVRDVNSCILLKEYEIPLWIDSRKIFILKVLMNNLVAWAIPHPTLIWLRVYSMCCFCRKRSASNYFFSFPFLIKMSSEKVQEHCFLFPWLV